MIPAKLHGCTVCSIDFRHKPSQTSSHNATWLPELHACCKRLVRRLLVSLNRREEPSATIFRKRLRCSEQPVAGGVDEKRPCPERNREGAPLSRGLQTKRLDGYLDGYDL